MPHITIQGHQFEVPDHVVNSIAVGYTLQEEGEAHALRQTKLENLRNNFAGKVKTALNGAEELSSDQLSDLQTEFNTYAEGYKFGIRQAGTGTVRRDPVEREMLRLAKDDIAKAYFAKYGEKADKDMLSEKAEQLIEIKHDDYAKRARAIMRQREQTGTETLESLGI